MQLSLLRFRCRSTAGGNPTVGNFLDSIAFSVPVVACPTKVVALNTNPPPTTALPVLSTSLGVNTTVTAITVPPSSGSAAVSSDRTSISYTPNAGCVVLAVAGQLGAYAGAHAHAPTGSSALILLALL